MPLVRTFLAWKKGDEWDDCQDSIHPLPGDTAADNSNAFAVSDGATTSFFSRAWARILTSHFAEKPEEALSRWDEWLEGAQEKWKTEVGEIAKSEKASFFVVNGFHSQKPAGATFAGVVLGERNENGWPWRAQVLGDSCIFILGADGPPRVMEIQTSAEFSNLVKTAESWARKNAHVPSKYESLPNGIETRIQEHDAVLIASDALSKWMLRRLEAKRPIWGSILELDDNLKFQDLVAQARSEAEDPLENDDVALAVLKFGDPHPRYQQDRFDPKPAAPPALDEHRDALFPSLTTLKEPPSELPGERPRAEIPGAMNPLPRPGQRKRRFVGLLVFSVVSLLGFRWLAVSRNRALDYARTLLNQVEQLSAEKNAANATVEQLSKNLGDAKSEQERTRQNAENTTALLSRKNKKLEKELKDTRTANQLTIAALQNEISGLKEKLTKSVSPPVAADTSVPASK